MFRVLLLALVLFGSAVPALAKPHDLYPVSCDVVWKAVKSTLSNHSDFAILGMSDASYTASFIVLGNLTTYTDRVTLDSHGESCTMKLNMYQVGPDFSDERVFRHQFKRWLAKLQASEPKKPEAAPSKVETTATQNPAE